VHPPAPHPGAHRPQAVELLRASAPALALLDCEGQVLACCCEDMPHLRGRLEPGVTFAAALAADQPASRVRAALDRALLHGQSLLCAQDLPCPAEDAPDFEASTPGALPAVDAPNTPDVPGEPPCPRPALEWRLRRLGAGPHAQVLACAHDVSHHVAEQRRLRERALRDPLTGLPNRVLLEDRLRRALSWMRRAGTGFALLALDLDGFKQVNDSLGHGAGDLLLREAAQRMRRALREQDTLARMGGDEFLALLPGVQRESDALAAGARLIEAMRTPFAASTGARRESVLVGISAGAVLCPQHATQEHALLEAADRALYRAKRAGRNCTQMHEGAAAGGAAG
jgi:diguanylate cyclase (GGDEF)-like protein